MKKNRLFLLVAALVILIIGYMGLLRYNNTQAEKVEATETSIFVTNLKKVTELVIDLGEGRLEFVKHDSWQVNDHPEVTLSATTMKNLSKGLAKLEVLQKLEGDLEDASAYGLQEPRGEFQIKTAKGEEATIKVGNELSNGTGSYVQLAGEEEIYVLSSGTLSSISSKLEDYVEVPSLPSLTSDSISSIIQTTQNGTKELLPDEEVESTTDSSGTDSESETAPFEQAAGVFSYVGLMGCSSADPKEEELKEAGLSESARTTYEVAYTDDDQQEVMVLYLGKEDTEASTYHVQIKGNPSIFEANKATLDELITAFE